jgi:cytochrome c oxidase cbb3-type subunit 3
VSSRLLVFAILFAGAGAVLAQQADFRRIEEGRRLFEKSCTACHGQNARGGRGPDLTGKLSRGALESEIVQNIIGGIPGTQMPAFPMAVEDARAIVAYLWSLRAGGPDLPVTGSAANGQRLFFGQAGCSRCHMYRGQGGRLGPDLTGIGEAKTVRELQRTISEPHRELTRGFETIEVRLRDGRELRGVRKNEDTFSLQMMDEKEKLHLLLKKDVAGIRLTGNR